MPNSATFAYVYPLAARRGGLLASLAGLAVCLAACAGGQQSTPKVDGGGEDSQLVFRDGSLPDGRVSGDGATPGDGPWTPDTQPQKVTVQVQAPLGGEQWEAGSAQLLRWASSGPATSVDIELHKGGSKVTTLTTGQPAGGSWNWSIDVTRLAGDDYTIVVVEQSSGEQATSQTFSILNWQYRRALTVDASVLPAALTNYPVALRLTPQNFDYSHARADGADLRVATAKTLGNYDVPFWIERWDPQGESLIWINVASLDPAAPQPLSLSLFYGNPTITTSPSDEAKAFPSKTVVTSNKTLDGTHTFAWYQLEKNATLSLTAGKALRIEAQRIVISGDIDGRGAGHAGGASQSPGTGPGAGGKGTNAGGGGGGYGGAGGRGGYDGSDTRGAAGPANGDAATSAIDLGSGGAGGAVTGGAGGGSLTLVAEEIVISGNVDMDGLAGNGGDAQNGGGGSGGGILLIANHITLSGSLSARGGAGGSGSSTYQDGGGGGGGGRIKVFHGGDYKRSGTLFVDGGAGGRYGDQAHGEAGKSGTTHSGNQAYTRLAVTVGAEGPPEVPAP